MRKLLKHFILDTFALWFVSQIVKGISFAGGEYTLFLAGLVLMLSTMVVKPVLNILLLPLNLVTFGLFKWVTYAITLYLVTLIVPGFSIGDFVFSGYSSYWFSVPAVTLIGIFAFVAYSFSISLVSSTLRWIFE
jgi:putative membrane protein